MPNIHTTQAKDYNFAFIIGISLNALFVAIEAIYGVLADSLALLADAGHNLSDVLSLILAWGANLLARKKSTETRTYGFRKITVLASTVSALFLLIALGGIVWEAIKRLNETAPVNSTTVITVAAIGVLINTLTALLFISGQKYDLNIKAAFLHMAADAAISLGVVIAGLTIMYTGWFFIDPVISIVIVLVILIGTWGLLKDSFNLSIDAVPPHIDIFEIKQYLSNLAGVVDLHDLHVWALSTTETALTVHLHIKEHIDQDALLHSIQKALHTSYRIEHATIQMERQANTSARHDPKCG